MRMGNFLLKRRWQACTQTIFTQLLGRELLHDDLVPSSEGLGLGSPTAPFAGVVADTGYFGGVKNHQAQLWSWL